MNDIIITGYSNVTSEGVTLHLNKPSSFILGNVTGKEFWVSWDKIGSLLFDSYTQLDSVKERNELRGKANQ